MKAILQRGWMLVPALLLLVPMPGQAKPVPLAELTQDLIRTRVGGYLAQDTTRKKLAPLDQLARLDAKQITYRAEGGQPRQLTWAYEPVGELNNVQRSIVEMNLDDVLTQVFGNFEGGLLSDADAVKVFQVTRYAAARGAQGAGGPAAPDQPTQPRPGAGGQGGTQGRPTQPPSAAGRPAVPGQPSQERPGAGGPAGPRVVGPPVTYTYVTQATVCYYAAAPSYWGSPCWGWGYWVVPVVQYSQVPVLITPSYAQAMPSGYASIVPAAPVYRETTPTAFSVVRRKLLLKRREPGDLYVRGVQAYGYGDYQEALDLLSVAVQLDSQDARYWYYKALTERALGEQTAAGESARRGAALELLGKADPTQTGVALERAQGGERQFLRAARDVTLTREVALRLAAEPVPGAPPTGIASSQPGQGEGMQMTRQR